MDNKLFDSELKVMGVLWREGEATAKHISDVLAEEVEDERSDSIIVLENGCVDAGDLARTAFILEMDAKTLCSEDCKGICPGCGVDLNQGSCTCKKEVDPRLAVLARLLEKDANQ